MVSNSLDIHSSRISSRAHKVVAKIAEYEVSCCFLFIFLKDLVLLLPFCIHIKLLVSEIASFAFYYHAIRSRTRVF